MPKLKYLDSISVELGQVDNLFRIILNHLALQLRSSGVRYQVAFDPEFQMFHAQVSEETVYIQIERQIEKLSAEIRAKSFENFQVIFQLCKKEAPLRQSYISTLFKPRKAVVQEFLLHVALTPPAKVSPRARSSASSSLRQKLKTLLSYTQKNREALGKLQCVSARAFIKSHF